jgi:hypothetical protein
MIHVAWQNDLDELVTGGLAPMYQILCLELSSGACLKDTAGQNTHARELFRRATSLMNGNPDCPFGYEIPRRTV